MTTLRQVIESLLFASQKPLQPAEIGLMLKNAAAAEPENRLAAEFASADQSEIFAILRSLQSEYAQAEHAFRLVEVAGGWQLVSCQEHATWIRQLYPEARPVRLSAPALETLAIVAYRQPITRADIEAVRGVAVDGVLQTLLERGLIETVGRADLPGRPQLYGTTEAFLRYFGLRSLADLPNAEELRRAPLPSAAASQEEDSGQALLPLETTPPGEELAPFDPPPPDGLTPAASPAPPGEVHPQAPDSAPLEIPPETASTPADPTATESRAEDTPPADPPSGEPAPPSTAAAHTTDHPAPAQDP